MMRLAKKFVRGIAWGVFYLVRFPFWLVNLLMELTFSQRGLAVGCLAVAALFVVGPWMRPSLSRDLRGVHIPLGLWDGSTLSPQDVVMAQRQWRLDSVGAPLLAVIAVGVPLVLIRPRWLPRITGPLITLGIAACAIAMLNHPLLVDVLDDEWHQRGEIRMILGQQNDEFLTVNSRPRVPDAEDEELDLVDALLRTTGQEPSSGWALLVFGPWLVWFCLLVTLVTVSGSWTRRLGHAAAYVAVGFLLAGAVTSRRLVAEYHWNRAVDLEEANRFGEARLALNSVLMTCPEFVERAQFWRLRGQLDFRDGREGVFAEYFRIRQWFASSELDQTRIRAHELLQCAPQSIPLANLVAEIEIETAFHRLMQGTSGGSQYYWNNAVFVAPWRLDGRVGLAIALAKEATNRPDLIKWQLHQFLDHIGDRVLRSDLSAVIGDAYFEAGDFATARDYYDVAMDYFSLPKYVNIHVQERLLGM